MGDGIQAAKAGILEIADLFVVNKADKPDTHQVVRDLRNMIALADRGPDGWKPPIITHDRGPQAEGIAELVTRLDAHWAWLDSTGELASAGGRPGRARRSPRSPSRRCGALADGGRVDELARQVADGDAGPVRGRRGDSSIMCAG